MSFAATLHPTTSPRRSTTHRRSYKLPQNGRQEISTTTKLALAAFGAVFFVRTGAAQEPEKLDEVRVIGHYENAVGTSDAASQGYITPELIEARPMLRPGEVLEYVPGVIITQHSGDGKANQYFLRGFNLDHGTDFRTEVDHMPVNMPTHAHGQGYSDLNFLIPELVQRIGYKKGPYFADEGDFSSAGAADISYYTKLQQGIGALSAGGNGYVRAMAANSSDAGPGTLLYGLELFHNDGPWDNPEDYRKANGVMRFSQGTNADGYTLSLMAYSGKWNATDQIAQRAVDRGDISRFGAIDPSDGGLTSRYSISLDRHRVLDNGGVFHMDAYAIKYKLKLFSNFTYFLDDQTNGDQFEQADSRWVFGLTPSWIFTDKWAGRTVTHKFGADVRRDNIDVALVHTLERQPLSTTRSDYVQQTGAGLYYENTFQWTEKLRSVAGVREDFYYAHVTSNLNENSGTTNAHITSPKLSLIYGPFAKTEYFLNYGQGFHSNDARGTTITVDPATGQPVEKVPALVKSKGEEIGVRTEAIPKLQSSLSLWRLTLGSELVFVGDAGTTEASRPSLRRGIEWSNRYIPKPWLLVDLDLSASRAQFTDNDPTTGNYIPGAIDRVASFGVTAKDLGPWSGTMLMRYFGPRPLVEDNSVRSSSSLLWSARASYKVDPRTQINLDILNLFDRKANDIEYYYASQLRSEAAPVNDIHFHPAEPRTFRVSLVTHF
ncbi:MAG TPA: TonB-dependent receptor [Burkholderiales bacterium]|nr:TonB-dependent receptor [Burkholderiales bacterium]